MAFTPPPHPNTRPRGDGRALGNAGDRAFVGGGPAPVGAGRSGRRPETSEAIRAVHAANARLIGGKGARPGR